MGGGWVQEAEEDTTILRMHPVRNCQWSVTNTTPKKGALGTSAPTSMSVAEPCRMGFVVRTMQAMHALIKFLFCAFLIANMFVLPANVFV